MLYESSLPLPFRACPFVTTVVVSAGRCWERDFVLISALSVWNRSPHGGNCRIHPYPPEPYEFIGLGKGTFTTPIEIMGFCEDTPTKPYELICRPGVVMQNAFIML